MKPDDFHFYLSTVLYQFGNCAGTLLLCQYYMLN